MYNQSSIDDGKKLNRCTSDHQLTIAKTQSFRNLFNTQETCHTGGDSNSNKEDSDAKIKIFKLQSTSGDGIGDGMAMGWQWQQQW